MDKNTIIGFTLIGLILIAFAYLNQPDPAMLEAQKRFQDSVMFEQAKELALQQQRAQLQQLESIKNDSTNTNESDNSLQLQLAYGDFANAAIGTEEFFILQNDKVEVKISTKGGNLYSARLKEYVTFNKNPLVLFEGHKETDFGVTLITANNRVINTSDLYFTPITDANGKSLTMRLVAGENEYLDFNYSLDEDDYMLHFNIQGNNLSSILSPNSTTLDLHWNQKTRKLEQGRKYEDQYTGLYYKYAVDDVENLSESNDDQESVRNEIKWIAYKNKFFSTILIADDVLHSTNLQSRRMKDSDTTYLKEFFTTTSVNFDLHSQTPIGFRFFIGPNKYKLLCDYDKQAEKGQELKLDNVVPLGYKFFRPINKYFIVPVFNFLDNFLDNYGLIIFLLTLIVKLVLFPLTYKSYLSSAKMRVLRPQVEEINAQYPKPEQAMDKQKAVMNLYSRAGANPMSGCLPMLLQMPILIALYWLFPTSIELRQESFLWAKDLSTFDAIVSWEAQIPLISSFVGNHISLFCVLMTAVNVFYTKFNMDMTNTGQQQMPGMKMMMYLMPLMMFFFFNQNSAGLSYYFLVSTIITLLQTLAFRAVINENKLLQKLEANKKKPKKTSGFMQKLEEAQRIQQQKLKQQQKQASQKNIRKP